jgi:hypothetical protein
MKWPSGAPLKLIGVTTDAIATPGLKLRSYTIPDRTTVWKAALGATTSVATVRWISKDPASRGFTWNVAVVELANVSSCRLVVTWLLVGASEKMTVCADARVTTTSVDCTPTISVVFDRLELTEMGAFTITVAKVCDAKLFAASPSGVNVRSTAPMSGELTEIVAELVEAKDTTDGLTVAEVLALTLNEAVAAAPKVTVTFCASPLTNVSGDAAVATSELSTVPLMVTGLSNKPELSTKNLVNVISRGPGSEGVTLIVAV